MLSDELHFLLNRTQRFQLQETTAEPSEDQLFLLQRVEFRKWRENEIVETTDLIREYAAEIRWMQHMRTCRTCLVELTLAVQRYHGRCCPWYLDLNNNVEEMIFWDNEDFYPPDLTKQQAKYLNGPEEKSFDTLAERPQIFKKYLQSCPRIEHYHIGSYWTAANLPADKRQAYFDKSYSETVRFIKDRMTWAEQIIHQQIRNACKYLRLVIGWDLNPDAIPAWQPYFLEESLLNPHFLG